MVVNANQIVGPMWDNGSPCNNNLTLIIYFPFHVNVSCVPSIWHNLELLYLTLQWDNRSGFRPRSRLSREAGFLRLEIPGVTSLLNPCV